MTVRRASQPHISGCGDCVVSLRAVDGGFVDLNDHTQYGWIAPEDGYQPQVDPWAAQVGEDRGMDLLFGGTTAGRMVCSPSRQTLSAIT